MEYKKLLFEQLKIAYPNAIIDIDKKIITLNINGFGTICLQGDVLVIEYNNFSIVEDVNVKTFLKPRLKFESVDIYNNKKKISFYDRNKYTSDKIGAFNKSMRIFNMFDTIVKEVNCLLDAINE
jgi:hypothetical protein